jgi:hypothetical protein
VKAGAKCSGWKNLGKDTRKLTQTANKPPRRRKNFTIDYFKNK